MITPAQCLEARTLLKWTRDRLASRCGVSADTLRGFELGRLVPRPAKLAAIQRGLEEAGVDFIDDGKPGMKLRRQE